MKKLFLLIGVFAILGISSCKKDEDDKGGSGIVGKWYLYSTQLMGMEEELEQYECADKSYTEFKEDKTYVEVEYTKANECNAKERETGKYEINGNTITYGAITGIPFEIDGDKLIFDLEGLGKSTYKKM